MANTFADALRKLVGMKKEEKKKKESESNSKKVKSKKVKIKIKKVEKRVSEKEKKKKLKKLRLENLEKAREKREKEIEMKKKNIEREKRKEERLNKLRLRNLEKARKEREKEKKEAEQEKERIKEIRLKNLRKGREKRERNIEKERRKEKKRRLLRLKNLEKARKERIKIKKRAGHHKIYHKKGEVIGLVEQQFTTYEESVPRLLHLANFGSIIKHEKKIILKPNLTLARAFPTTTDSNFVEEIIKYIKKHNARAKIIVAEGSGGCETKVCFKKLGYEQLSEKYHVALIDLNEAESVKRHSKKFKKYAYIEYPKELLDGFLISLPVLKGHSEAKITFSLKNMLGCFPARHYGGNWKVGMHKWPIEYSIHDILAVRMPDYAICDASIAQLEHEINGYPREMNLLLAGNPLEADKRGALLLGYDWKRIPHLVLADELARKE